MAADRLTQRQIIKGCIGLVSDAALDALCSHVVRRFYLQVQN